MNFLIFQENKTENLFMLLDEIFKHFKLIFIITNF